MYYITFIRYMLLYTISKSILCEIWRNQINTKMHNKLRHLVIATRQPEPLWYRFQWKSNWHLIYFQEKKNHCVAFKRSGSTSLSISMHPMRAQQETHKSDLIYMCYSKCSRYSVSQSDDLYIKIEMKPKLVGIHGEMKTPSLKMLPIFTVSSLNFSKI